MEKYNLSNEKGIRKQFFKKKLETIELYKQKTINDRKDIYGIWDSNLESFSSAFHCVLPERYEKDQFTGLKNYIENDLKETKGSNIGVEVGGIGNNLFRGFSKDFFKKTYGITLIEHRTEEEKRKDENLNSSLGMNHKVLEGNLLSKNIYNTLEKELNNKKVNFIIERMIGGHDTIPNDFDIISKPLKLWYRILEENGIILMEIPPISYGLIQNWVEMIEEIYKSKLEVKFYNNVIRLKKLKDAPKELPVLKSKHIKEIK